MPRRQPDRGRPGDRASSADDAPERSARPPARATSFVPVDPIKHLRHPTDANCHSARAGFSLRSRMGKVPATGVGASPSASRPPARLPPPWRLGRRLPKPSLSLNSAPGPVLGAAVTPPGWQRQRISSSRKYAGTTELTVHVVGYYPLAGGQLYRPTKTLRLYDCAGIRPHPGAGVDRMVRMPALSGIPATR